MKQENLAKFIFWGFAVVKLLGLLRTTTDTWAISHDVINVLLIDGLFAAMWIAAAYGGKGESALTMRPFAAIGAWVSFAFMIAIGWQAHQDATAFASRVAIGIALAYDTWDMLRAAAQHLRIKRNSKTLAQYMDEQDERAKRNAYKFAMSKTQAAMMQRAADQIAMARIQAFAQQNLQLPANVPDNGYILREDGHIRCLTCGWQSPNTYRSVNHAQPVYAAHTRGATHRGALTNQIIEVES